VNRSSRISLVITLTAAFLLCKHTLAIAVQGAPDLSGFDSETQQSIELACVTQFSNGPVAYRGCLNKQVDALRGSPGIPSLSGIDSDTRQSIELACVTQFSNGPVAYGDCLRTQLDSIGVQPRYATGSAPTRKPRGGTRGDATRVRASPPISSASNFTVPVAGADRSQATPHEHRGAYSPWQDPGFWALVAVGFVLFIYLTPILWVLFSSRSRGGAKLGWFLVVVFFCWLGLAVFLIVTQAQRSRAEPDPY
jgi:hypothetical protein